MGQRQVRPDRRIANAGGVPRPERTRRESADVSVPQEKLLIITDIFNDFGEPRPNDPPPGLVSPYYAALGERVRQLKLDVQRIAPSHGRGLVPVDMLWKALQERFRRRSR